MISYGSNLPGGIFLPILSLGAILGALFGEFSISYLGVEEYYLKKTLLLFQWLVILQLLEKHLLQRLFLSRKWSARSIT